MNHVPDSDDESVDEVADEYLPQILEASAGNNVEILNDPTLDSIGEQIREIEDDIRQDYARKLQNWKINVVPQVKASIEKTEEKINALRSQIKSDRSGDDSVILSKKLELKELRNYLDSIKRKLYFPENLESFGSDGLYIGYDNFWLQNIAGAFDLEVQPAMGTDTGKIILVLSGQQGAAGAVVKCRLSNFKLYGESVTVPTLTYDDLQLELAVTVVVVLSYQVDRKTWTSEDTANDFEISLKDFKGPFGLSTTVVNAVLGVATPVIREHVLRHLSVEAGDFVTQLPVPLIVKGAWSVTETYSIEQLLDNPIYTSTRLSEAMKCTPLQLLSFVSIQKSLRQSRASSEGGVTSSDTSHMLLLSLKDLLKYVRTYGAAPGQQHLFAHMTDSTNEYETCQQQQLDEIEQERKIQESRWLNLKGLWDEASLVYFSLTKSSQSLPAGGDLTASFFSFENLLLGVKTIELNPIRVHFEVQSVEGQVGLKSSIDSLRDVLLRTIEEVSSSDSGASRGEVSREQKWLEKAKQKLNTVTRVFDHLLRNLDFVQAKISTVFNGGDSHHAHLDVFASDVKGQGPVELLVPLPQDRVLGFAYIVPFLINMTSTSSGDVGMKLYRLSCLQMLEYCNFQRFMTHQRVVRSSNTSIPSAGKRSTDTNHDANYSSSSSSDDDEDDEDGSDLDAEKGECREGKSKRKYTAEELISLTASQPSLSIVVDKKTSFDCDQSLVTFHIGGTNKSSTTHSVTTSTTPPEIEDDRTAKCALTAHTAPHVRLAMSSPRVSVHVKPIQTLQFLMDHFKNPELLAECVAILSPRKRSNKATGKSQIVPKKSELISRYAKFATLFLTLAQRHVMNSQVHVRTDVSLRVIGNGRDIILCMENQSMDKNVLVVSASVNAKEVIEDVWDLWDAFVVKG